MLSRSQATYLLLTLRGESASRFCKSWNSDLVAIRLCQSSLQSKSYRIVASARVRTGRVIPNAFLAILTQKGGGRPTGSAARLGLAQDNHLRRPINRLEPPRGKLRHERVNLFCSYYVGMDFKDNQLRFGQSV